jgi:hypothetical protein
VPRPATEGYDELFLTRAEKKRLAKMGVRGEDRREAAKIILAGELTEKEDVDRLTTLEDEHVH